MHEICEYPDIEALRLYASSNQGNEHLPGCDDGEERCNLFQKPIKIIIRTFINNITVKDKDLSDGVKVQYRRDPVGEMLVKEGVLTASRVYPYSDTMKFPISISQLPKIIRNVALCRTHRQCDDNACFHRSIMGLIKDPEALSMSEQIISNKDVVYDLILSESGFFSWVGRGHIKTIIHAISNGMTIHSVKTKYGGAGPWLIKWAVVPLKVTTELCDDELGARGTELIDAFFPEKKCVVDISDGDIAGPRTVTIKRDPRITYRFFKSSESEALGLNA